MQAVTVKAELGKGIFLIYKRMVGQVTRKERVFTSLLTSQLFKH